jgi:DNA-3-methyladenine glycosylase
VLVRAGEVVDGLKVARARRPSSSDRDLARGPARLTVALGVTGDEDGVDLLRRGSALRLTLPTQPAPTPFIGPRTGVGGAGAETPWRFWLPGEPTVSPYRAATRRR